MCRVTVEVTTVMRALTGTQEWEQTPESTPRKRPLISNAVIGTVLFIFAEAMFFAGLISVYLVVRSHEGVWPPAGQPRLPVESAGLASLVLLFSAFTIWRCRGLAAAGQQALLVQWLGATLLLGLTFLAVQGYEWYRLLEFGLTTRSSVYGGIFYVLIGAHGLHLAGAWCVLLRVFNQARRGGYTAENHSGLQAMRLFWFFVVGIWPILYLLIYLW